MDNAKGILLAQANQKKSTYLSHIDEYLRMGLLWDGDAFTQLLSTC